MAKFTPLTTTHSLQPGHCRAFTLAGQELLLANVDGKYFAIEDRCSHEDSPLSLGCLKGELISCTLHGSRFNVKTGVPTEEPAIDPVKTFKLRIVEETIEVDLDQAYGQQ